MGGKQVRTLLSAVDINGNGVLDERAASLARSGEFCQLRAEEFWALVSRIWRGALKSCRFQALPEAKMRFLHGDLHCTHAENPKRSTKVQ